MQETLLEAHAAERGQFIPKDRREVHDALATGKVSRNFLLAASVEEPVARILRCGKASAPILSTRLGSLSWWTSSKMRMGLLQPL